MTVNPTHARMIDCWDFIIDELPADSDQLRSVIAECERLICLNPRQTFSQGVVGDRLTTKLEDARRQLRKSAV